MADSSSGHHHTTTHDGSSLHTVHSSRLTIFNRVFALIFSFAILVRLYHHVLRIFHSATFPSFFISLSLLLSDLVLAFMWVTSHASSMNLVCRKESVTNLEKLLNKENKYDLYPPLDLFICTADPYKEPPIKVVNPALSVMAYDYPAEKISVYVSDDGGSAMTLFAFMEAAKFASYWLPFCRQNDIVERNPDAFFTSNRSLNSEAEKIKMMYERMKIKVEDVLERRRVDDEEHHRMALNQWNVDMFTSQDHPTIIEVVLEKGKDRDITGHGSSKSRLCFTTKEQDLTSSFHSQCPECFASSISYHDKCADNCNPRLRHVLERSSSS